jgi:hypothetical protein
MAEGRAEQGRAEGRGGQGGAECTAGQGWTWPREGQVRDEGRAGLSVGQCRNEGRDAGLSAGQG